MTRCHEDESSGKVLNFLERLDDRIGSSLESQTRATINAIFVVLLDSNLPLILFSSSEHIVYDL